MTAESTALIVGDDVEQADAAVDERPLAAPRAGDRRRRSAGGNDERCENQKRSECRHELVRPFIFYRA
jgi:hypothetical protein